MNEEINKTLANNPDERPLTEEEFQQALEVTQDWSSKEWIRSLPPEIVRDLTYPDVNSEDLPEFGEGRGGEPTKDRQELSECSLPGGTCDGHARK